MQRRKKKCVKTLDKCALRSATNGGWRGIQECFASNQFAMSNMVSNALHYRI